MQTDRKLLQKIREKKIAMGHKPDDHPDEGMTMYWNFEYPTPKFWEETHPTK